MRAAEATSPPQHGSEATRFSELAELTPSNVQGLLPLVPHTIAPKDEHEGSQPRAIGHGPQIDSLASVDKRLRRFLTERVQLLQSQIIEGPASPLLVGSGGFEVSYLTGTRAAMESGAKALGDRELRAWDPIEQRVLWRVTEAQPSSARALVTAGGLVFYGTTDGWLKALDVRTGRILWKHLAKGRKLDEPFSYRGTDGHQYIAVHSLPQSPNGGRTTLLAFTLAH